MAMEYSQVISRKKVSCISWNPEGSAMACGFREDGVVKQLRSTLATDGKLPEQKLGNHSENVTVEDVAYCPGSGELVASVGRDSAANLWDVRQNPHDKSPRCWNTSGVPTKVQWHSDGNAFAVGTENRDLQFFDARKNEEPVHSHPSGRHRPVLCSYGNYLLSFTGSGELELISWEKMQVVAATSVLLSKPLCISLAPDTTKFAVGNLDSTISIFRTRDALPIGTFDRHKCDVDEISYLSDSETVVSASPPDVNSKWQLDRVDVFSPSKGNVYSNWPHYLPRVDALACSPKDKLIALGSIHQDKRVESGALILLTVDE